MAKRIRRDGPEGFAPNQADSRALLEAAPDGILIVDQHGMIVFVNKQAEALFGYSRSELVRRPIELLVPDAFREKHERHRGGFIRSPEVRPMGVGIELFGRRKDGTEFPVDISLSPLPTASGGLSVFATVRDMSERRKVQQLQAHLAAIVESSDDAIYSWTLEGVLTSWNGGAEDLYGYTAGEAIGQPVSMLMPPDRLKEIPRIIEQLRRGEVIRRSETIRRNRDGKLVDILLSCSPIRDQTRAIIGVSAIARDITEVREGERQLRASLREKDILLNEIHHRVKNNLQVISSLIHLQSQHVRSPELQVIVEDMQNRIRSIALVHEKLYQATHLGSVSLHEYLHDLAIKLFYQHDTSRNAVKLDTELGHVRLSIDKAIPCGLIANELVTNAFRHAFAERGTGAVRIRLTRSDPGRVCMAISDDGIGIPPEIDFRHARTFGFQLVCALVEQLNGTIELHPEKGTHFEVTFAVES